MTPETVVAELWACIQARDWAELRGLLADDLEVDWPVSGERFVGPDNYIGVQRFYPEGWSIRLLRLVSQGNQVVAEVEVPHQGVGVFRAAMFATVEDGKLRRATEYWTSVSSEEPPQWRREFSTPADPTG